MQLPHFALLLIIVVSAPAIGQDAQDTQSVAGRVPAIAQDTQDTQGVQGIPGTKPENPAEPEAHGTRLQWKDLPKNLWKDQKAIVSSPLHINRDNAKWWVLFGAGTAALLATDRKVSDHLPQSNTQLKISKWASRAGADYTIYPLTALFYFYGKADDNPRARDTARIGIEALADAEITVNAMKAITQRPRPEAKGVSIAFWRGGDAFPSGHSIQAWALARVIAREFPEHRMFPILAYGLASTVSLARIGGRRHSPSDVFVGSAMGFFIGDYVYRHHHAPSAQAAAGLWLANHVNIGFQVSR